MIIEFLKYLTNPASITAKKLGQLKEIIAIEARYNRSKKQWAPHLLNSQETIKSAAASIDENSEIVILGSGLLLDVPLEFLANKFSKIILVDVVHLNKVKRIARKYDNVMLIEHDITGLAQQMLDADTVDSDLTQSPSLPFLTDKTQLVVSANLLSQLHLAPVFYAKTKLKYNDKKLITLAKEIMHSHVNFLKNLPCQTCLIVDNKRLYKNQYQIIVSSENVLIELELPKPDKTWYWEVAPLGELEKNLSMCTLVYAYQNFSEATL